MLSRARALRHVVASISKLAPEVIQGAEACSTSSCPCSCREAWLPSTASSGHGFATLPPDYARMRLNYPKRRAPVPGTAVQEAPDEGGTPIPANQATPLQGGARAGGSSRSLMAWQACCWLCCFGRLLCYIKSFDSSMLGRMSKLLLSQQGLAATCVAQLAGDQPETADMGFLCCSHCMDVPLGAQADGRRGHPLADLGTPVLGRVRHGYSALPFQSPASSAGRGQGRC